VDDTPPTWHVPSFTEADIYPLIRGFFFGGVQVMPEDSLVYYCYSNTTSIKATWTQIGVEWRRDEYESVMTEI